MPSIGCEFSMDVRIGFHAFRSRFHAFHAFHGFPWKTQDMDPRTAWMLGSMDLESFPEWSSRFPCLFVRVSLLFMLSMEFHRMVPVEDILDPWTCILSMDAQLSFHAFRLSFHAFHGIPWNGNRLKRAWIHGHGVFPWMPGCVSMIFV